MANRAVFDVDIDRILSLEEQQIEEIRHTLGEVMNEIKEMKHLERNFIALNDFLTWASKTKKWFEKNYDAKMLKAEEHPDEKKAWKHAKYRRMAKLSRGNYKKLNRALKTFDELEQHKKRLELLNQKLKKVVKALLPEVRTEFREELNLARA